MKREQEKSRKPVAGAAPWAADAEPAAAAPFRGAVEAELDQFKDRLLDQLMSQATTAEVQAALRHAANEAAAVAWTTPFPLLFLPALLEEKAQSARRHAARQERIKRRPWTARDEAA